MWTVSVYSRSGSKLLLTDIVVESEKSASEFTFALHDHPYLRADTSINKFCVRQT